MKRGLFLADLTTLRVGGPVRAFIEPTTEAEFIEAVRSADEAETPMLVMGGGSNLLVSDAGFDGVVVRDARREVSVQDDGLCGGVSVTATAGTSWDDLVVRAVEEGWVGIEALSGIPGSTGATPVQNVGAYGQEVAESIASVRTWDRHEGRVRTLALAECGFGYRDSLLKQSQRGVGADGLTWHPTPRYVVLDVTLHMRFGTMSAPIAYDGLARELGLATGERAPLADVRAAVLTLRRAKGMVLDPADPDTRSAGSFFTNPLLDAVTAEALPADAPRYSAEGLPGVTKTSAAWLIEHAGFGRGFALAEGLCQPGDEPVALSSKHTLAITNRDGATAEDILALARHIRDGVREAFGVTLEPEPVFVGLSL